MLLECQLASNGIYYWIRREDLKAAPSSVPGWSFSAADRRSGGRAFGAAAGGRWWYSVQDAPRMRQVAVEVFVGSLSEVTVTLIWVPGRVPAAREA